MKLVATLKLQPIPIQSTFLRQTLTVANEACDYISAVAWKHQVFGGIALHHLTYYDVRSLYGLSAQLAFRCIGKVVDSYKVGSPIQRTYCPDGAMSTSISYSNVFPHRLSATQSGFSPNIRTHRCRSFRCFPLPCFYPLS